MDNIFNCDASSVRTDQEGRYCLNDVQKALTAGMNTQSVDVNEYLRRPETIKLITTIENSGNSNTKAVVTHRGRNSGIYAVMELVYGYLMWISPDFHRIVIQNFRRLNEQGVAIIDDAAQHVLDDPLEFLELLIAQAEEIQAKRAIAKTNVYELRNARKTKGKS